MQMQTSIIIMIVIMSILVFGVTVYITRNLLISQEIEKNTKIYYDNQQLELKRYLNHK